MPMNGDTLGAAIAGAINALPQADKEDIVKVWKAVANQIVAHVQTATVTVTSVSGVTPGGGVSGPGTGTIT